MEVSGQPGYWYVVDSARELLLKSQVVWDVSLYKRFAIL